VNKEVKQQFLLSFGNNLKRLRQEKDFSQERLANELGIEISQISRIERGVLNTAVFTAYQISKILEVELSELFKDK
jgi:transcriptional regulator with XRE-family HTH domain